MANMDITFKKITVQIPDELLKNAQEFTQEGVTQTVNAGLEKLAASLAYQRLGELRGKFPGIELDGSSSREGR